MKHTKGPWKVMEDNLKTDEWGQPIEELCIESDETIVCMVGGGIPKWEQDDNAHLIAAAPEMLEALETVKTNLEAMQPAMDFKHEFDRLAYKAAIDATNEAIRKAKGGE